MSRTRKDRRRRIGSSACRNHGSCSWCLGNRLHSHRKGDLSARQQAKDLANDRFLAKFRGK